MQTQHIYFQLPTEPPGKKQIPENGYGTPQDLDLCQYFLRRHVGLNQNGYENLR